MDDDCKLEETMPNLSVHEAVQKPRSKYESLAPKKQEQVRNMLFEAAHKAYPKALITLLEVGVPIDGQDREV